MRLDIPQQKARTAQDRMNILGIRFRTNGQIYYFSSDVDVPQGGMVMVETEQGLGLGTVVGVHNALPPGATEPLTPILRVADDEDRAAGRDNDIMARQAHVFCQQCIRQRKLEMKLVDVEVYHDRSKIIFYFTAPARIDFRELVKDLVREYRSRIELRQIGVRHETQMVGAVGNCGMVCCCRRYLRKFAPVTIRMAKEQNLFLNPAKISGICGRLLCCLSYEQENYDAFHRNCPRLGKKYQTNQGGMKVLRANMFRNTISVLNENNEELEFTLEDWQALEPRRPEQAPQPTARQEKAPGIPGPDSGLLVVSVTPETVDELTFFDEALPEDESPETQGGRGIFGLAPAAEGTAPAASAAAPDEDGARQGKRRKRRRRPRGDAE